MTPAFRITVDGRQDVTKAIRERLLTLRISDQEGYESDEVEISLDDRDGEIELPRRGAELRVELGYDAVPETEQRHGLKPGRVLMGRFTVDEVEISGPPATLTIRGKAADMRAELKARKTRAWHQVSLGDVVSTIAGEHGLAPAVARDLARIELPHVDQTDESDLHLLTRLADRYDATAKPGNGRLVFARRAAGRSASNRPLDVVRIEREQARNYRVVLADRPRYQSVRAYWWDAAAGERVAVTAGDSEPAYALRDNHADEAQARAAAQARLDALRREAASLTLRLAPGRPTVTADSPLELVGFRGGVNGRWIATRVRHELTGGGYLTQAEAEREVG